MPAWAAASREGRGRDKTNSFASGSAPYVLVGKREVLVRSTVAQCGPIDLLRERKGDEARKEGGRGRGGSELESPNPFDLTFPYVFLHVPQLLHRGVTSSIPNANRYIHRYPPATHLKAEVAGRARAAREAKTQHETESRAHMSDGGAVLLVELHIKYEAKFDNHSSNVDAVWEHVHHNFLKAVLNGDLPVSDERVVQVFKDRWMLHCYKSRNVFRG